MQTPAEKRHKAERAAHKALEKAHVGAKDAEKTQSKARVKEEALKTQASEPTEKSASEAAN